MSGIVGIANFNGQPVDRGLLVRMTRSLAPRGPDAQEIHVDGHVGLGHALLRTTWESADERQPHTFDGRSWITADCRVDGREDLCRELEAHECKPRPEAPDVELILRAYSVWGEHCVDHLLGDFSFAIWDGSRQALFCARDHFGIKPFLYTTPGRSVAFSNTLSCLRMHPAVSSELDEMAIADFLVYGYPLDLDRSSFAEIRRLPPSHTMTISRERIVIRRYWQLPVEDEIRFRSRAEYVERFRELLQTAVRDRLRTNRVGVFMSGGLDSPTVAATAHRVFTDLGSPFDLRAHTVVFDRIVPDEERRYSQLAAEAIGIPIRHYPFDDYRFPPLEPEPDWFPPEPRFLFDRGRTIAVHRGPASASRVLLRADGADPLIETPASALEARLKERQYGRLVRDVLWLARTRRQVPRLGIRTLVRKLCGRVAPVQVQPYPEWIARPLERRFDLKQRWEAENSAFDTRPGFELAHAYWPYCLESLDLGSMQLAAEIRFPFLDVRLARYLLRLPAIPWGPEKSLLRVAMKGVLPERILRRRKAPLAGNPWAVLLPSSADAWWKPYMSPATLLERFVDIDIATATLAGVTRAAQKTNQHSDIDRLRSSLRPMSLNLWLRQTAYTTARPQPAYG